MKRQNLFFILITFSLMSCNLENKKNKSIISEVNIEDNLKNQVYKYMNATYTGNADLVIFYTNDLLYLWLYKTYPEEFKSLDMAKEGFKSIAEDTKKMAIRENMKFQIKIGEITKKIKLDDELIYVIEITSIIEKNKIANNIVDEIVSFSNDNGKNWTFLKKDEQMLPELLKLKYSETESKNITNQLFRNQQ